MIKESVSNLSPNVSSTLTHPYSEKNWHMCVCKCTPSNTLVIMSTSMIFQSLLWRSLSQIDLNMCLNNPHTSQVILIQTV